MSEIKKFTNGLFSTTAEFLLFTIFYGFEVALGGRRSLTLSGIENASKNALDALADLGQKRINRAIRHLEQEGLIRLEKGSKKLTQMGIERLKAKIPIYQEKRPWDGSFYLVSYDIPIKRNYHRDTLRYFLRKIGCGMLQKSLWITPYNPASLIRAFVEENNLSGMILVSKFGKDGSIGGLSPEEIINSVYDLAGLEERYREFLKRYESKNKKEVPKW
jgi:DNA-binding transcriptional regulator PaaX